MYIAFWDIDVIELDAEHIIMTLQTEERKGYKKPIVYELTKVTTNQ